MAERIFKKLLSTHTDSHSMHVSSAGVDALEGLIPDRNTIEICNKQDVHIVPHKARQLTKTMLKESDLILCMTNSHKQSILNAFPKYDKNIFLLREYLREHPVEEPSIKDPTGKSIQHYEICFKEIEKELKRIFPLIVTDSIKK